MYHEKEKQYSSFSGRKVWYRYIFKLVPTFKCYSRLFNFHLILKYDQYVQKYAFE